MTLISMINTLFQLGRVMIEGKPTEELYDLGKGEKRSELLVTRIDGDTNVTDRIASSPLVKVTRDDKGVLVDITDSGEDIDVRPSEAEEYVRGYAYRGLRPCKAVLEPTEHPQYELGDLLIDLEGGKKLAISQYLREAA